ncbi:sulfotransferase family protein [Kordiimonas gwangyangensis]|uniref:sulfotransferase family protein n=1 Tax=Kordiimonas gwangyangensis TaxID=288022 RepID=UPI0009E006F3|nr:sulfotransferase [Kordiimonas gwangyangensis]
MTIMPNLFIIGAGKCGTTTLFSWLSQHPEIYAAKEKEPHYYSVAFSNSSGPWGTLPHTSTLAEYRALFQGASSETLLMEASASYLYYPGTAERIFRDCPGSRLIVLLRDPVERAISDYKMQRMLGIESRSLQRTIDEMYFPGTLEYLSQGLYSQQLRKYLDIFDQNDICILIYEDFFSNVPSSFKKLLEWLHVNADCPIELRQKYNVGNGKIPLNNTIFSFSKKIAPIFRQGTGKCLRGYLREILPRHKLF